MGNTMEILPVNKYRQHTGHLRPSRDTSAMMRIEKPRIPPRKRCSECGGKRFNHSEREMTYDLERTRFRIRVPMQRCASCGEGYVNGPDLEEAERAVAAEVARAGRVSPKTFKFMRQALNITGEEIAELLSVTKFTISRWENGKRELDRSAWILLSEMVLEARSGSTATYDRLRSLLHPTRLPKDVRLELEDREASD